MDPLWSETCWSTFKCFIILIVSTYYILCISWTIKRSIHCPSSSFRRDVPGSTFPNVRSFFVAVFILLLCKRLTKRLTAVTCQPMSQAFPLFFPPVPPSVERSLWSSPNDLTSHRSCFAVDGSRLKVCNTDLSTWRSCRCGWSDCCWYSGKHCAENENVPLYVS